MLNYSIQQTIITLAYQSSYFFHQINFFSNYPIIFKRGECTVLISHPLYVLLVWPSDWMHFLWDIIQTLMILFFCGILQQEPPGRRDKNVSRKNRQQILYFIFQKDLKIMEAHGCIAFQKLQTFPSEELWIYGEMRW